MKGSVVALFLVLTFLGVSVSASTNIWGVFSTPGVGWKVVSSNELTGDETAWATYRNTMNITGWSVFNVTTSPSASNENQAYAAGFLEVSLKASTSRIHSASICLHPG
jgi:hypothetical protein